MSKGLESILNFVQIDELLGTAGQPTGEQFELVQRAGYQAVINLALSDSTNALPDERRVIEGLGMQYVHIPVSWTAPQPQDFDRFCAEMKRLEGNKLFVHCAMNMRVTAFTYLYRVLKLGVSPAEARRPMDQIWTPEGVWADFIADRLALK
jgi:protein tyrosine phosphatase (PTP) superfamily phosphohydrolase (DUF442 family)